MDVGLCVKKICWVLWLVRVGVKAGLWLSTFSLISGIYPALCVSGGDGGKSVCERKREGVCV